MRVLLKFRDGSVKLTDLPPAITRRGVYYHVRCTSGESPAIAGAPGARAPEQLRFVRTDHVAGWLSPTGVSALPVWREVS